MGGFIKVIDDVVEEKEKHQPKDDCLGCIIDPIIALFKHPWWQIYVVYSFIVQTFVVILQTYFYLSTGDINIMKQYGPLFCGTVYEIITVVGFNIIFKKGWKDLTSVWSLWEIGHAGEETKALILKSAKIWRLLVGIDVAFALLAYIMFVMDIYDAMDIWFVLHFAKTYFPDNILYFSLLLHVPPLFYKGVVMMAPLICFIYGIQIGQFQLMMIRQHLANVQRSNDFRKDKDISLVYDIEYQKRVFHVMVMCINNHNECIRIATALNNLSAEILPIVTIFGVILGISTLYYVFMLPTLPVFAAVRLIFVVAAVSYTCCLCCVSANGLCVMLEEIPRSIYDLPWYTFNARNQKVMLSFLTGSQGSYGIKITSGIIVDNRFLLNLYKISYSLGSVVAAAGSYSYNRNPSN